MVKPTSILNKGGAASASPSVHQVPGQRFGYRINKEMRSVTIRHLGWGGLKWSQA